jgi:hypothetical protein
LLHGLHLSDTRCLHIRCNDIIIKPADLLKFGISFIVVCSEHQKLRQVNRTSPPRRSNAFVLWRYRFQILARKPAIPAEISRQRPRRLYRIRLHSLSQLPNSFLLNELAQVVTLRTCIGKVFSLHLGRGAEYSALVNAGIVS